MASEETKEKRRRSISEEPDEGTTSTEEGGEQTEEEAASAKSKALVRADAPPTKPSADSLDPALVDPVAYAQEQQEGTVNDAAARLKAAEDGGVLATGDVDVATVPESEGGDEWIAPLTSEDWVILGESDLVPAALVGARANIIDGPRDFIKVGDEANTWITVRTRDDKNATLTVSLADVTLDRGGRQFVRG